VRGGICDVIPGSTVSFRAAAGGDRMRSVNLWNTVHALVAVVAGVAAVAVAVVRHGVAVVAVAAVAAFTVLVRVVDLHIHGDVLHDWYLDGFVDGHWNVDGLDYWVWLRYGVVLDIVNAVGDWDGDGLSDENTVGIVVSLAPLSATISATLAHPSPARGG